MSAVPVRFMIRKIMVAVDGSDASRKAAMVAVDIAHQAIGSITAVYVMETDRLSRLPGIATLPELNEKIMALMQEEGQQATQFVEDQARRASVPCRKILAQGRASEELIRISQQQGIDLLVMGSMGRTGMEKILLGDVAEKVVHNSTIPVLLAK